ncbi:MAG: hypothetical protein MJ206_02335 [Bacilli bacterium]|nr:hypothetical protein [Bacilli bacterium]
MKKLFSVLFCLIPLTFSCGKHSSLDFPNPFPNDEYERIGRRIAPDEEMTITISKAELAVLARTIGDEQNPFPYNKYITKCDGEIHYRSYELAFANEFRQGYDSLNQMSDTTFNSQSQGYKSAVSPALPVHKRAILKSDTDTIKNYVYGNVAVKQTNDVYWYLHGDESAGSYPKEYEVYDDTAWGALESFKVSKRSKTTTNTADPKIEDEEIAKYGSDEKTKPDNPDDLLETQITQNEYLKLPTDAPDSGVTRDGHLVLVSYQDIPYPREDPSKDGIYELRDGRKFRAVHSTMKVACLKLQPAKGEIQSWYLVDKARVYEEDSITSEEIQPNVPITDINPVTIGYTESIYHFKTEDIEDNIDPLPGQEESNQ